MNDSVKDLYKHKKTIVKSRGKSYFMLLEQVVGAISYELGVYIKNKGLDFVIQVHPSGWLYLDIDNDQEHATILTPNGLKVYLMDNRILEIWEDELIYTLLHWNSSVKEWKKRIDEYAKKHPEDIRRITSSYMGITYKDKKEVVTI